MPTFDQQAKLISKRVAAALKTATLAHSSCDAAVTGEPVRDSLFAIRCRTCGTETHVVMQVLSFEANKPETAHRIDILEDSDDGKQ